MKLKNVMDSYYYDNNKEESITYIQTHTYFTYDG